MTQSRLQAGSTDEEGSALDNYVSSLRPRISTTTTIRPVADLDSSSSGWNCREGFRDFVMRFFPRVARNLMGKLRGLDGGREVKEKRMNGGIMPPFLFHVRGYNRSFHICFCWNSPTQHACPRDWMLPL